MRHNISCLLAESALDFSSELTVYHLAFTTTATTVRKETITAAAARTIIIIMSDNEDNDSY